MSAPRNEVRESSQGQKLGSFDHNIDGKYFQVASNQDRTRCFIAYKILLTRTKFNMASVEFDGSSWGPATGIPVPKNEEHSVGDSFCVCFDPNDDKRRLMFFILEDGSGGIYMRIGNSLGQWEEPAPLRNAKAHRYSKLAAVISDKKVFLFCASESSNLVMRVGTYSNGSYTWKSINVAEEVQPAGDLAALHHKGRIDVVYRQPGGYVAGATSANEGSNWNDGHILIDKNQISKKSPMALTRDNSDKVTLFYLKIQEGSDSRVPTIYAMHLTRTADNILKNDTKMPGRLEMVGRVEPSSNLGAAFVEKPGKTARSYLFSVSKTDGQNVLVMRERTELLMAMGKTTNRWIVPNLLHTDPDPHPIGGI